MSGRRSRNKGARTERSIVNALQTHGMQRYACHYPGRPGGVSPANRSAAYGP